MNKTDMRSNILLYFLFVLILSACQTSENNETQEPVQTARRTIIAYVCGDNNLNTYLQEDIEEMVKGSASLPEDCRLILFADFCSINSRGQITRNEKPYIAEIKNDKKEIIKEYSTDFHVTSAENMLDVMQCIVDRYPAKEYALILTGHGNGAIIKEDSVSVDNMIKLYAYGGDATDGSSTSPDIKWMNMPSLATALSNLKDSDNSPLHFDYIFFDCCCMQTIEVAYELRNYTDYIIAAASETNAKGAPYEYVVPVLGMEKSTAVKAIIDNYMENSDWNGTGGIAISTVKTSELKNLMKKTRNALKSIYNGNGQLVLDRSHCIYYYRGEESDDCPVLHDMKNIMLLNLPTETYNDWLTQFDKTIIYKYTPTTSVPWLTNPNVNINFFTFTVSEDNYGGISMIVPYSLYDKIETRPIPHPSINKTMFLLEWPNAIGWHELGW